MILEKKFWLKTYFTFYPKLLLKYYMYYHNYYTGFNSLYYYSFIRIAILLFRHKFTKNIKRRVICIGILNANMP